MTSKPGICGFLCLANQHYQPVARIRLVLDNHSELVSRETRGSSSIRVSSKEELPDRIELCLKEVNEEPTIFKWKYKVEALAAESAASP